MAEFESVRIGDLGKVVTGKTPKTEEADNFGNDYMFIGPIDLHKHFFISKSEKMISDKGLASIKGSSLNGLSILVGCVGWDMGNVGIVEGPCATNQQINSITNIKDRYNPLYIYYWLKTKKKFLFKQAGLTRTPILNKTGFSEIIINLPKERNTQDKTADLLVALDAKIDLNNRINAELEALAKTIYDYWFVQFDFPDAHGRPYKSSGGAMVWNDTLKREIPKEWEARPISELVPVSTSSIDPARDPDKTYRHLSIPGFDASGSFIAEPGRAIGSNKFTVERRDLLVSKLNPWFNRVVSDTDHEDMICSTEFVVWRCGNPSRQAYLNMIATHPRFVAHCTQSATGTSNSHKRVNPQVMMRHQVPHSPHTAEQFGNRAGPMLAQRIGNTRQNVELTQLRDWLLPLLMNGQVRVAGSAS